MPPITTIKRPKNLKQTIHRLLSYMGNHKVLVLLIIILVALSASANLLGTYMLRPIIDTYTKDPHFAKLWYAIGVEIGIYSIGVLATLGYSQIMIHLAQKIIFEMRRDIFQQMEKLPLSYFDRRTHGEIMSNYTNDIDTLSEAMNNAFAMLISNTIQIIGLVILLFVLNWFLSIIVILFYAIMATYIVYASKKSKKAYGQQQHVMGKVNGFVEETISGQKVVKVFNHEEANIQSFKEKNLALKEAGFTALKYSMSMIPMVVSISYINYAIVAILGGLIALGFVPFISFTIGGIASYLVFVRQAAMPINQFTNQSNLLLNGLAGAERLFQLMDEKPEIDDGETKLIALENKTWAWEDENGNQISLKGDVRFYTVDFSYIPGKKILRELSLYAKPGQKIAFVGATGVGKTTITNLINRFYEIEGGKITYDGIDIQHIKKDDLRQSLGIVLQDTSLFTGTIKENIRYGKLSATDEEIIEAAKLANAHNFIKKLPKGYDTFVSADGGNLSQGQRQLLSIARAAVANTPVLILDEATSSIDTRTERLVQEGMDKLMQGRTVFVIAHRLSTVRNADAILVLDKGKVIERGTHEELLALKGIYYNLYTGKLELD
ncbi:MAG: ABC transporter ATP-binding protein/permease [Anaeroplasmataceae bacterium]|nr:ABC transporter ATP-binding protein/permease [Anaeroplasmataceae bacterium]